ncbi:O-antigen ligase family protein [Kordia sp.]|uniref:O-antigen ligase family protein n=1 Tax=Kordia sp. TaxID=1965332 RepID=UPI003B59DE73
MLKFKDNIHQNQVTLLAVFGLLMPFSRIVNVNMVLLGLVVLLAIITAVKKQHKEHVHTTKELYSLIIFFGVLLFSLLYTTEFYKGQKVVVRSLPILLFALSFLLMRQFSKKDIHKILKYYVVGCALSILYSFLVAFINYADNPLPITEGFTYFTLALDFHPSYFALYIIFAFCIFVSIFDWTSKTKRWIPIITWFLLLLFILFLRSRAPLIILLSVTILMLLKKVKKQIAFTIVAVLLIPALFYIQDILELISQGRSITLSLADRFHIWSSATDIIKENVFLGVGVGDYQVALDKQYFLTGFDKGIDEKFNCHNQYLQTFLSVGLIGLLSLLSIFFFIFKKGIQSKSFLPFYFLICISILMFFDSVLILQHGVYFFSFFAVILLKFKHNSNELT